MTRESIRLYLPLVGFVVPTLVIGYGIVIPRSCIAGVNELSIGFGTTVLGAAMTYIAGLRLAAPSCKPRPLRRRIEHYINRQAASPRGLFGRLLGVIWKFEHRRVNRRTLELLGLTPHHDVLEVGSGPGFALRDAAAQSDQGRLTGIDVSELMVRVARQRNAAGVRSGRVDVRRVDSDDFGLVDQSFDRIFSVHCLYFWKRPEQTFSQLARALRPGGRLVVAFRPDTAVPERFKDDVYRFYAAPDLAEMLARTGFERIQVVADAAAGEVTWISAERARQPG